MLVIIGLLIGGIFVGQSLIHNAQLNAVITEFNRYRTAVSAFKQQYQALPGDMNNATSFWGIAAGTGGDTTCGNFVSTTSATCNGNGDGQIQYGVTIYENYRFWQHLADAKMIEGQFTGTTAGAGALATPGINVPLSKYGSATGWSVFPQGYGIAGGSATFFNTDYGPDPDLLFIGASNVGASSNPALPPKDGWSIDKKIDDGKPATGNVLAITWTTCTNAASNSDLGSSYLLTSSAIGCGLAFIVGF